MEGSRAHILVVDDDRIMSAVCKLDLEGQGFRVSVAGNASDALADVRGDPPDLVVMDIRMPGMDGLELMGRILSMDPGVPVILNTAYSCYQDSFTSWAADAYVIKSADTEPLLVEIRRLLEASGRRRAAAVAGEGRRADQPRAGLRSGRRVA